VVSYSFILFAKNTLITDSNSGCGVGAGVLLKFPQMIVMQTGLEITEQEHSRPIVSNNQGNKTRASALKYLNKSK
jgi:hypothetical protein